MQGPVRSAVLGEYGYSQTTIEVMWTFKDVCKEEY